MIFDFQPKDQHELAVFVLGIQNGEFNLAFKKEEQPDLMDTAGYYKGGGFWLAKIDHQIVGCIGLQKLNNSIGVLRKMFVKKELRGSEPKIAQKLFDRLKDEAIKLKIADIYLDTPAVATASHHFYIKNGFVELAKAEIPEDYSYPDRNSKIFKLAL